MYITAHAKELGNAVPTSPVLFLKPSTSLITQGHNIVIPYGFNELHHEIELGVVISKTGKNISKNNVQQHISGYIVALDMTNRTLQEQHKKQGLPWSISKGTDTFTPISKFIPKNKINDLTNVSLWCTVNDKLRQQGNTSNMLFNIESLISHISTIFTLEQGDIILTGTPEGVGPVKDGDIIKGGIKGLDEYDITFNVQQGQQAKL